MAGLWRGLQRLPLSQTMVEPSRESAPRTSAVPKSTSHVEPFVVPRAGLHFCTELYAMIWFPPFQLIEVRSVLAPHELVQLPCQPVGTAGLRRGTLCALKG